MDTSLILFYVIGIVAVFAVSILVYIFSRRFKWTLPSWIFYILIALSAYIFFAQYLKYQSLHFYVDFSHWAQIIYSITKTGLPNSLNVELLIPGMFNYFSVHFVPLIYFFAIPFKFLPYSETIIVLNGLLMLSSAIPLYKLAVRLGGNKRFGLFMAALFLWYPTFQYITLYEFEMLRFSIPILLWMLYFFETRKIIFYFLFALLAILVREEVGLTVAMFGFYIFFIEKKRIEGLMTATLGFGSFFIVTQILMPFFSNVENFQHIAVAGSFSQFGETPIAMIKGILMHPKLLLVTIINSVKFANIGMLFLPLLFIPLLAPTALIGILANIGVGLMSDSLVHTSYMLYYIAPSVPFVFYAFIKSWPKLIQRLTRRLNNFDINKHIYITYAAMNAILSGLLVVNIFFGPSPFSLQFWFKNIRPAPFRTQNFHYSVYRITDRHKRLEQFVSLIPNDAVVSTQQFIQPRLFKKAGTMIYPQLVSKDGNIDADYVLIDKTNNDLNEESPAYIAQKDFDLVETDEGVWQAVRADDWYILYVRK